MSQEDNPVMPWLEDKASVGSSFVGGWCIAAFVWGPDVKERGGC